MLVNLLASVTAGAISNTLTAPIWTIRTRMMTQTNHEDYRNSFHAAQKIYKTEGLYALYRGVIPSMWGLVSRIFYIRIGIKLLRYRFMSVFNFHYMNILRRNVLIDHLLNNIIYQLDNSCLHRVFRN
jgi:hypothetical protein